MSNVRSFVDLIRPSINVYSEPIEDPCPGQSIQPIDPTGTHRMAPETGVFPQKTSRIRPDFVPIFAVGLRSRLRRKRSDWFLSNTIIG
jgi:hypothetical protein